ncbi:CGNR zinc finger domain-containing protein [Actinopolymorpha alba]|uniref:CGNR zinc finger domain-containing protein n=1 Tax=Actinopolymorpha alba TaxID=533267 RepID=UPI00036774B2|nr:CGNR zinc finger domain-containing protein [Actinopolymorpha alba]
MSVDLVNELVIAARGGQASDRGRVALPALARILTVDPPSVERLIEGDVPGFTALAHRLYDAFREAHAGNVDQVAGRLNALLAEHPAHPHLAKEDGRWRLHHHPADADLIPMWTAICSESLARMVGDGHVDRLGTCEDGACGRVFIDLSKNASRRFCSTRCQNRAKAAAFRNRKAAGSS